MEKKPKRTVEELRQEPVFREMVERLKQMSEDRRQEILREIKGQAEEGGKGT